MVLGFKFNIALVHGGGFTDYSSDVQSVSITLPCTSDLPSCTIVVDNGSGKFTQVPLWSILQVILPNNVGSYIFYLTSMQFDFTSGGGGAGQGHFTTLTGQAAPELVFLSEGNLAVVGTDITVQTFWSLGQYSHYTSTTVSSLNAQLMDVGNLVTALLHTPQPNQLFGYRGRLGYDVTGAGVAQSSGIDYQGGPMGLYIKGMWQVGLGSTGAQKSGLDLLKDVVSKNLIDATGNPQVVDFYVDNLNFPPLLRMLERGAAPSAVTFTEGVDPILEVHLPVDTTDIRNFIVYWANTETIYPNGGDAWSNYANGTFLQSQWGFGTSGGTVGVSTDLASAISSQSNFRQSTLHVSSTSGFIVGTPVIVNNGANNQEVLTIASIGSGTLVMVTNLVFTHFGGEPVAEYVTRFNGGSSIHLQNSSTSSQFVTSGTLNMQQLGYRVLQVPVQGLVSFDYSLLRAFDDGVNDSISVTLTDTNSKQASYTWDSPNKGLPGPDFGASGAWQDISAPIPSSGLGNWHSTDGFDFLTSQIVSVEISAILGHNNSTAQHFFIDQIHFVDNWQFSPVYSFNPHGATATSLVSTAAAGDIHIFVLSTAGFILGQQVIIDPGGPNQEGGTLASNYYVNGINQGASSILLNTSLQKNHWGAGAITTQTALGTFQLAIPAGQPNVPVLSTTGFQVGYMVTVNPGGSTQEVLQIASISAGSPGVLVMGTNLQFTHVGGVGGAHEQVVQGGAYVIGATHDPNSVDAYGYRIFNFVDFYTQSGGSDASGAIAMNLLNSRKGKKSTGTIKIDGISPKITSIKPGSTFSFISPKDVYVGVIPDSTITGWIADSIQYDITISSGGEGTGFVATYTVEPWYTNIGSISPDSNPKNRYRQQRLTVAGTLSFSVKPFTQTHPGGLKTT